MLWLLANLGYGLMRTFVLLWFGGLAVLIIPITVITFQFGPFYVAEEKKEGDNASIVK